MYELAVIALHVMLLVITVLVAHHQDWKCILQSVITTLRSPSVSLSRTYSAQLLDSSDYVDYRKMYPKAALPYEQVKFCQFVRDHRNIRHFVDNYGNPVHSATQRG